MQRLRIINIGSVLGFLPMPYAATKHAIEGYSESLDHELRTRGIRVSVIEPAYNSSAHICQQVSAAHTLSLTPRCRSNDRHRSRSIPTR